MSYRIRKERSSWNVLQKDDEVWYADYYIQEMNMERSTPEKVILEILLRYPFLTADQISYLSGIPVHDLAQPINQLTRSNKLHRGLTRIEAPDEIFALPIQEIIEPKEVIEPFVLEKRDALVEIIGLERYFEHSDSDYWLFVDGIPQAEFDLNRVSRSQYQIKKFQRFRTASYGLQELLSTLQQWGERVKLHIDVRSFDDPLTKLASQLTNALLQRGYQFKEQQLTLDLKRSIPQPAKIEQVKGLNWNTLGIWVRQRQGFDFRGSPSELVNQLGQIDDLQALAFRLRIDPKQVDLQNIVFMSGINFRLGFVHLDDVEDIVKGWPKIPRYNATDRKIFKQLDTYPTTVELEDLGKATKIRQRLRYLEKCRRIRRYPSFPLDFEQCRWMNFDQGLELSNVDKSKRALASLGKFLLRLLQTNPPLTTPQISKYLGISKSELDPLISRYLEEGKILNGYYFDGLGEEQFTVPEVLDAKLEDEIELSTNRVDILPLTDSFAFLHLPLLVLNDSTIQPTDRPAPRAEQWMIMWDGVPVGYLIKTPTEWGMIDYELEIRISRGMVTTPIITGTIEQFVSIMRGWYNEEGKLVSINGDAPSSRKWEHIQFLIESIGIEVD
jgi:hypothetical protein